MGPAATAHFMQLFVREMNLRGRFHDHQFPRTIVLSLPLMDWGTRGSENPKSVSSQVKEGVHWLEQSGAEIIGVPCNTVHEFLPETVVSMVKETIKTVSGRRVGLLCSAQTRSSDLFGDARPIYLKEQVEVDDIIESVIYGNRPSIDDMVYRLIRRGAEIVVLGCTELSLCSTSPGLSVVDSCQVLARTLAGSI